MYVICTWNDQKSLPCSETDSLANLKHILGLALRQEYFTDAACMNTF